MKKKILYPIVGLVLIIASACSFLGSKPCFEVTSTSMTELGKIFPGEDVFLRNCTEDAMAYSWDFGDGTTSTLESPHHTWEEPGDYTITLTAETEKKSRSLSKEITVSPSLYGTWTGEAVTSESNTIPITFEMVQEGTKLKGTFIYGQGGSVGVISSHSNIQDEEVLIKCSYQQTFFFNGESFTASSLFTFGGSVNAERTRMEGEVFTVGTRDYESWFVERQ